MSELQWNLLNTNAPAQVAASFNPMGSYLEGAQGAQKLRMNELAMQKQENDIQYNPMKIMSQIQKNAATTEKTQAEVGLKDHQLGMASAQEIATAPPGQAYQTAKQVAQRMATQLKKSPEELATKLQEIDAEFAQAGGDDETFRARYGKASMTIEKAIGLLQGQQRVDQGQQGLGIRQQNADTYRQMGQGNLAVNQSRLGLQEQGLGLKEQEFELKKSKQENAPQLTSDAIENAANRYNLDGTLPPLGMGQAAVDLRTQILTKAAEQMNERGVKSEDQRPLQIGATVAKSAMIQLGKQEAMIGAFEKTFIKNVDMAEKASEEVDRSGIPIVNKWVNAGKRAVTGDPALSKFDIAIKAAVNEYTKIISGSMGNTQMAQAEVEKVNSLLNAAQTKEQVKEVLDFMRQETDNRMQGFKEQKGQLQGTLKLPPMQNQVAGAVEQPAPLPGTFNPPQKIQGPISIKSEADYQALPPGTEYIAPDGSRRRKK